MSLVWTESFVGWSTPVGIYTAPGSPGAPIVGGGPNGQNTYYLEGSYTLPKVLGSPPATVGVGVRWKTNKNGNHFILLQDTGAEQVGLAIDAAGRIQAYRGATLLGQSAPGTIVFGNWYYITVDATIHATAGSVLVAVDHVYVLNLAGVNTQATAHAYVTTVVLSGSYQDYVCDWYITDNVVAGAEPVATIGDVRIVALRPSGVGSNAAFTPSAGANWQNVDDAPVPDDDATYNASATPTDLDSFVTPGLGAVVANTIPAVFVKSYARKDDAGVRTLAGFVKLGASTETAAGTPLSAGYAWQADKFPLDPAGAAWTKANVNAAEFGYGLIA